MHEALGFAELARQFGKSVIVWFKGDLVPIIPFNNNVLFLPGIVRSRMSPNYRACPVFIDDPMSKFGNHPVRYRRKKERPSVGFCGYGSISSAKLAWSIFSGLRNNVLNYGQPDFAEFPIVPATIIRDRAMRQLEKNRDVNTRFIRRTKYTSNRLENDLDGSVRSFFENMFETDYTLCVRGFGNWSYRFYETLASGRIPVFLDTKCVLPLESAIDWRRYCVWVERSELKQIGDKLLDFHSSLGQGEFHDLQVECRSLWEQQLTLRGCMENLEFYLTDGDKSNAK